VTVTYTYDDNDKMTAASGGGQTASFGYDGAGSMTSASGTMYGAWALVYDDESRPTSITYPSGGGSVTDLFTYNALGQRMRARLNGTWYRFFYNGNRVLEETNDANGPLARYTTESGSYYEPVLHFGRNDGSVRYPLYDGIGTVRRLADQTGALTDSYTLDTFGRQISVTGTTPNRYRFGGAWGYITDPSGMQQLGARFYWPEVGRFVQQDPAKEDENWYSYVDSNPVTGIDPTGLETCMKGWVTGCKLTRATGSNKKRCPKSLPYKIYLDTCYGRKTKNPRTHGQKIGVALEISGAMCYYECTFKGTLFDVSQ